MDLTRCTCGELIGAFRDPYNEYLTIKTALNLKEHKIEPRQMWVLNSVNSDEEFFDYIGIRWPCCRTHMKNYFDPIKHLRS